MYKFIIKKYVLKWIWFVLLYIFYVNGICYILILLGNFCVKWVGIWWNRNINIIKIYRKIKCVII